MLSTNYWVAFQAFFPFFSVFFPSINGTHNKNQEKKTYHLTLATHIRKTIITRELKISSYIAKPFINIVSKWHFKIQSRFRDIHNKVTLTNARRKCHYAQSRRPKFKHATDTSGGRYRCSEGPGMSIGYLHIHEVRLNVRRTVLNL